jgi:phasin
MSKKAKADMAHEMTSEIPADMTALAQKTVDQAQAAFEKANDMAHSNVQVLDAAASAYKARLADIQMKAMEITQINVNAGFAFARKLFSAKDASEFFALQQDFAREHMQTLQRQAAEMNELSVLLAKETVKPMQEGFSKSFGDFTKSVAA